MEFLVKPIGLVHSPFKKKEDIKPEKYVHPQGFDDIEGELEIFKEYEQGLADTEGFSHLILIFAFHLSEGYSLMANPFLDQKPRGLFATRSPFRPNPIGLTVVKLIARNGNILRVSGLDVVEGTPILDIKPYTPRDQKSELKLGWLSDKIKNHE